jgi:hypothetical protein
MVGMTKRLLGKRSAMLAKREAIYLCRGEAQAPGTVEQIHSQLDASQDGLAEIQAWMIRCTSWISS